jgi:hypothetical protein
MYEAKPANQEQEYVAEKRTLQVEMYCKPLTESVQLVRTRPKTISVIGLQPLGAVSSVE